MQYINITVTVPGLYIIESYNSHTVFIIDWNEYKQAWKLEKNHWNVNHKKLKMSFFWLITLYEFGLIYIKIYISGPGTETVRQRYQVSTVRRFQVYQQFLCRKFRIQAEQSTCVLLSFFSSSGHLSQKGS